MLVRKKRRWKHISLLLQNYRGVNNRISWGGDVSKAVDLRHIEIDTYWCTDSTVTGRDTQTLSPLSALVQYSLFPSHWSASILQATGLMYDDSSPLPPHICFIWIFFWMPPPHWAWSVFSQPKDICATAWIPVSNRYKYNILKPLFMPHCY